MPFISENRMLRALVEGKPYESSVIQLHVSNRDGVYQQVTTNFYDLVKLLKFLISTIFFRFGQTLQTRIRFSGPPTFAHNR